MCKKYQYLYLLEKLSVRDYRNDMFACELDDKRITFYYDWLNKINKKYNYIDVAHARPLPEGENNAVES